MIVLALVGSLALIPACRKAYVFLCAATWAWILGTLCYYLLPSLGPYAAAPGEFAGLRHTPITDTQAEYLAERAAFLADPSAADAFVSLGAFASLHVGFTTLVFLMARYYGLRRTSRVLAVYLAAVIISTVYFGWHYVLDDIAGVLLAAGRRAARQVDRLTAVVPGAGRPRDRPRRGVGRRGHRRQPRAVRRSCAAVEPGARREQPWPACCTCCGGGCWPRPAATSPRRTPGRRSRRPTPAAPTTSPGTAACTRSPTAPSRRT